MTRDRAQINVFFPPNQTQQRLRIVVLKKQFEALLDHTQFSSVKDVEAGSAGFSLFRFKSCKSTGALHYPGLPCEDSSMSTHFSPLCSHYNHPSLFPPESPTWMFNYGSLRWPSGIQQSISILLQTAFEKISLNQLGCSGSGRVRMGKQEILRELCCVILSGFPGKIIALLQGRSLERPGKSPLVFTHAIEWHLLGWDTQAEGSLEKFRERMKGRSRTWTGKRIFRGVSCLFGWLVFYTK